MIERDEFERTLSLAGRDCGLYVSSGYWDDYVELVLPEGDPAAALDRSRLDALARESAHGRVDVSVEAGPPTTVCVTALYIGESDERKAPYRARVAGILGGLGQALPELDLGELAPADGPNPPAPLPRGGRGEATDLPSPVSLPRGGRGEATDLPSPVSLPHGGRGEAAGLPAPASLLHGGRGEATDLPALASLPRRGQEEVSDQRSPAPLAREEEGSGGLGPSAADLLVRARGYAERRQVHKATRLVEDALRRRETLEARLFRDDLALLERRDKRRQREPKSAQAQLEVGFSYLIVGCDAAAVSALREATRLQPGLFLGHVMLGVAFHHQGRTEEARAAYRAAARLRPLEQTPRDLLAMLESGELPPRPVEERQPAPKPRPMPSAYAAPRWAAAG